MNPAFRSIIAASGADRRDVFLATANRLGTTLQNVEKDFWVCWTLDALFNGLPKEEPRLLFKGGTSLSKAFGLISRFSEDIDITVFRQDIGEPASVEELESLSGKKRRTRLEAIQKACQSYIGGPLLENLSRIANQTMQESGLSEMEARFELDEADESRQSLLFWYPSVIKSPSEYVRSAVKIESGAKSALDPNQPASITPYVAGELSDLDLRVDHVTTVNPERTLWDKIIILHGQRRWFERRGVLRHGGQRVSRHYYDVFKLADSDIGRRAMDDSALGVDCARHARMFFFSADFDLEHSVPGTLEIIPTSEMLPVLERDYRAMAAMIFAEAPPFADIVSSLSRLQESLNRAQ